MFKFLENTYHYMVSWVIVILYHKTIFDSLRYITSHLCELKEIYDHEDTKQSNDNLDKFVDGWLTYMIDEKKHVNRYMRRIANYGYKTYIKMVYKKIMKE